MECTDLLRSFRREVEVLELNDDYMIYAIDRKTEEKDLCSIETMDLNSEEITRHITLDYTRLWESFRTYGQMPGFFYAVNVLADYRVRLRRIQKGSWENDMDILIRPEGEIINIYSLNEDYMIITDEVKADPAVLEKYNMSPDGHRYVNVRYLYEIKTAKKYPIKDGHFESLTEELPVRLMYSPAAGKSVPTLVFEAFYCDEEQEQSMSSSEILLAPVDSFIAHVKADGMAGFVPFAKCSAGFDYLRRMNVWDNRIAYRQRSLAEGREQIIVLEYDSDGSRIEKIIADYTVPEQGQCFYDIKKLQTYHCPEDEEAKIKHVHCLSDPDWSVSYDGRYGTFSMVLNRELMVTTYYEEVFVKEYEYHEYTAIHYLETGDTDTFEGKCEAADNRLVKMRSFLAL